MKLRRPFTLRSHIYLFTGYPTFGARQVVASVLKHEPESRIYAVVRDKLTETAQQHLATLPEAERSRVVLLEGDAASMDLGLSGAEFNTVTKEVTTIHHCAQVTYLGVERDEAEKVNFRATREILEFASRTRNLRLLVHHSTAFVAGDRTGLVLENELDRGQQYRNIVEETKAKAEVLIRSAMPSLPIAVVRPTSIVGDTDTGEVDRYEGVYLLVLLLVTSPADLALPLPGKGDAPLHVVPADFVARAVQHIGQSDGVAGKTFHLADPKPLTAKRVFELIAAAAGKRSPRGFLPANLTRALLHAPGLERFAKSPRTFLEQLITDVRFDTRNSDELFAGTGISCPPFETYVERLVTFVQDRERHKREQRTVRAEPDNDDPLA